MRLIVTRLGPLATASATAIALAQTVAGAANLTLNGATVTAGVSTLDTPRRVGITSAGNDSGITFTITGVDRAGQVQSEVVTGANAGVVQSALDYAKVTRIATSGASSGNVSAGTTGIASSRWVFIDAYEHDVPSAQVAVTGTVNYTVEMSLDDPNSALYPIQPYQAVWTPCNWAALVNATTTQSGNIDRSPFMIRLTMNSGTGSAVMTIQ